MKNLKIHRGILLIGISVAVIVISSKSYTYKPSYEIVEIEDEHAIFSYEKGNIYIGDKEYLDSLTNINDEDILVQDKRDAIDPNMIIFNSYRIEDKNTRNTILNCLLEYEKLYPSKWDRTIESLRIEWSVHNILYEILYERKRTTNVDLNNADETVYNNTILKRTFLN